MRSAAVVEVEVTADRSAGLADAVIGPQIHLLIFDAAPQPLDEDIVPPSALAVHADRNAVVGEHAGEGRARELRSQISLLVKLRRPSRIACAAMVVVSANRSNGWQRWQRLRRPPKCSSIVRSSADGVFGAVP